ncbi:hypothetical protein OTU49_000759 [Cherax quadricarinatus]|uniref:Uncharacterized protein n=1 Tax=Cherax quadricarinatus TaxID=27406 RepID=A0AAW0XXB8_CHEQU
MQNVDDWMTSQLKKKCITTSWTTGRQSELLDIRESGVKDPDSSALPLTLNTAPITPSPPLHPLPSLPLVPENSAPCLSSLLTPFQRGAPHSLPQAPSWSGTASFTCSERKP